MKLLLFATVLVVCLQMGWGKSTIEDEKSLNTDIENKQFGLPVFNTGPATTSVVVGNSGFVALGAYLLPPLMVGGALLLYLFVGDEESGSSSYGSRYSPAYDRRKTSSHDRTRFSSHDRTNEQKYSPYGINRKNLHILEWLAMGQEAWDKYDPSNMECQKRLICEIYQNKSKFGGPANNMVQLFDYLQYSENLSLPDDVQFVLEEYMDASENGRTKQRDCGDVYYGCPFSVNRNFRKFSNY